MKTYFALLAAMLLLFSCATSSGSLFEDTVAVEEGKEQPEKKPPKRKEQERERDSIWAAGEQEDRRKDEGWSIRIEGLLTRPARGPSSSACSSCTAS